MELIIANIINGFDFSLIVVINIITYFIIKIIDENNGNKLPTTWQKRIVFVIVAVICGIIYKYISSIPINIIFNSCIAAPIAWSWLAKPIAKRLGIDYKKNH